MFGPGACPREPVRNFRKDVDGMTLQSRKSLPVVLASVLHHPDPDRLRYALGVGNYFGSAVNLLDDAVARKKGRLSRA